MTKILPLLYITELGRPHPKAEVTGAGGKPFVFGWEEDFEYLANGLLHRGAHVRRYETLEQFRAEQFQIVGKQKTWPVYFDLVAIAGTEAEEWAASEIVRLRTEAERQAARIKNLETALTDAEEALADALSTPRGLPPTAEASLDQRIDETPLALASKTYNVGEPSVEGFLQRGDEHGLRLAGLSERGVLGTDLIPPFDSPQSPHRLQMIDAPPAPPMDLEVPPPPAGAPEALEDEPKVKMPVTARRSRRPVSLEEE